MSRKRIPLNQNGCTANFRIGVPFGQNLQRSVGLTGKDDQEVFEKLLEKLEELKKIIEIKPTIKDYGVDEKYFLETLDEMTEQAFNDQCTGTNPRYPLMSELKEIYLKAYYGEGNVPESRKAKEKKETK